MSTVEDRQLTDDLNPDMSKQEICGHQVDKINLPNGYKPIRCSKKVWKNSKCVWHANISEKPIGELQNSLNGDGERIDGAILKGIKATKAPKLLTGLELPFANLRDSELRGAILKDTKLKNADLTNADLSNSDIIGAKFDGAVLKNTYFRGSKVNETSFQDTDLSSVDFTGATVSEADFSKSNLSGASFEDITDFTGCDFKQAVLPGVDFTGVYFDESTDISEAILKRSNMKDATLNNCDLTEADLTDADLRQADLKNANLENSRMVRVDLLGTDLRGAALNQAHLIDAQINSNTKFNDQCTYENSDRWPDRSDEELQEATIYQYQKIVDLYRDQALTNHAGRYHRHKKVAEKRYYKGRDSVKYIGRLLNGYLSDYGESPYKVIRVSLGTIIAMAFIFPITGFRINGTLTSYNSVAQAISVGNPLGILVSLLSVLGESIYFSTVTFTTLGYGDVVPSDGITQALAMAESFVGALLMAYLVFVLGRQIDW